MFCKRFVILFFYVFVFVLNALSQETPPDSVQKTMIYLLNSDLQSHDKNIDEKRELLKGNVIFRHDSSYMYCDSAYFNREESSLEAFSNVRMEQGDTLFIYGDYLFYDGNIEMAKMRKNVRMVNIQQDSSEVILYTDSLNYNRTVNMGYYFDWGKIVDKENNLTSIYGQYSIDTKIAVFNDSVTLVNPNFVLHSDTLEYSTETKIATILGPSVIESDSGTIYSSRGWYDTQNNTSLLLDRSSVLSDDRTLIGDSLVYDRASGIGQAFGNMSITDTTNNTTLTGHYGYYDEKKDYSFATDSACALEYSQGDTLFMHADTLELTTIDSTSRIMRAYMGVRFYRTDLQGVCDSMKFSTKDSVLYMYGNPVVWNEDHQLFGDTIIIYMADTTIDYVHVPTSAFVVQFVEKNCFNQLGGNDLKAYFKGKTIEHIDIDGNAESVFYPLEEDSTMIGLNYTQSSYLSIWLNEGKLEKLKIWPKPTGKMTPIPDLMPEQRTLKNFAWHDDIRPKDKYDIFRFYKKTLPADNVLTDSIAPVDSLRQIDNVFPADSIVPVDNTKPVESVPADSVKSSGFKDIIKSEMPEADEAESIIDKNAALVKIVNNRNNE